MTLTIAPSMVVPSAVRRGGDIARFPCLFGASGYLGLGRTDLDRRWLPSA
jgi:hypothetical protein